MAIQIENYVIKCREKIESKSAQAAGTQTVRVPQRPVLVTFLGKHPQEGKRRFEAALRTGWPAASFKITAREKFYATPEAFREAIETEDDDGTTVIDRTILEATSDAGIQSTNLLMVYFINFNSDMAEEFLKLLDRPYTTPMGGTKERFIFAIGEMTTHKAIQQAERFTNALKAVAEGQGTKTRELWERTYCMMLSNYKYGGATLSSEEYLDNYSLAMSVLLMLYSVRSPKDQFILPPLPRVTDPTRSLMTATLDRESKPTDQIARSVLYKYFSSGLDLANVADSAEVTAVNLRDHAKSLIQNLYLKLLNSGIFPTDAAMRHFPGGAKTGVDAGLAGGQDKTMGTWGVFCKKYFIQPVLESYDEDIERDELKRFFAQYFSKECGFSCGTIQKLFPSFRTDLENMGAVKLLEMNAPRPEAPLREWGLYEARRTLGDIGFEILKETVAELSDAAGEYANMLSMLSGQVMPTDNTVLNYYGSIVAGHMGAKIADETVEEQLKRPCGEQELEKRLDGYIESITNLPSMRDNFFKEIKKRLADNAANNMVMNFLNLPAHKLSNDARMHLVGVLDQLSEAFMFDSSLLGVQSNNLFELCGTNGMDRVVLYRFDGSALTQE